MVVYLTNNLYNIITCRFVTNKLFVMRNNAKLSLCIHIIIIYNNNKTKKQEEVVVTTTLVEHKHSYGKSVSLI